VEIEELQRQNKDSFAIPEWFLYTSRAFLTLEGVSLQSDSNYSLIQSCFPYVAKRLVVDQDPRARQALRDLLYGASDAVDVERIRDLADGFSSYTTTTKTINNKASTNDGEIVLVGSDSEKTRARDRKNRMIEAESSITLAKDSADILLAPEGNLLQNLLIEESALAISASSRTRSVLRSSMVLSFSATLYLSGWDPS
jgi:predicted unusual protein kinase regulating ubiquinone biosynthesis (AarF/ABC1/UbiB family)